MPNEFFNLYGFGKDELVECFRRWKERFEEDPEGFITLQESDNYAEASAEYLIQLRDEIRAEKKTS